MRDIQSAYVRAALIAAVLGLLVAGGIGLVDALLNAVGVQRLHPRPRLRRASA